MDNGIIDIRAKTRKEFNLSFELIFTNKKATDYLDHKDYGLIFFWYKDKINGQETVKLPFNMDATHAADMAWGWLENQPDEKFKEYIDMDGSLIRAFRIFNENWTHVAGSHYGICAVQPIWGWFGK